MSARHQCCGLCHQGRRICPTPEACRVPTGDASTDGVEALGAIAVWAAGASLAVAVLASLAALVVAASGVMP